jgi:hypothetical protein
MENAHKGAGNDSKPPGRLRRAWNRYRVESCLELPDTEAVPRIRGLGQGSVQCLVDKIAKGGPDGAKAAHLLGRLAEWRHIECVSAIAPLEELLKKGDFIEAQSAAMALLAINTEESIMAALRGYVGGSQTSRKCVVSAFKANGNEWVRTYLEAVAVDCEDANLKVAAHRVLSEFWERH